LAYIEFLHKIIKCIECVLIWINFFLLLVIQNLKTYHVACALCFKRNFFYFKLYSIFLQNFVVLWNWHKHLGKASFLIKRSCCHYDCLRHQFFYSFFLLENSLQHLIISLKYIYFVFLVSAHVSTLILVPSQDSCGTKPCLSVSDDDQNLWRISFK
jgi:hypothetical protein